jgi:tetratricopeptide (TPR) repeat protein
LHQASEKEKLYIRAAYMEAIERNPAQSLLIYHDMARTYPNEKHVYYHIAGILRLEQRFDEAIEKLNRSLELDPGFGPALNLMAYMYLGKDDYERAIEYFERYASAAPGDANPLDSLGEVHFRTGRLDQALMKYKEALAVRPDFGSDWSVAYIHALKEDFSGALTWAGQYTERAPTAGAKASGHILAGLIHDFMGSAEKALSSFWKARELAEEARNPAQINLIDYMVIWAHFTSGEIEESLDALQKWYASISQGNRALDAIDTALINLLHGYLDLERGQVVSAESKLKAAESVLPKIEAEGREVFRFQFSLLRGEILLSKGLPEEAVSWCENLPEVKMPSVQTVFIFFYNLPPLKDILARSYLELNRLDEAIAEYERLISFDPASLDRFFIHPLHHYRLGRLYEQKGRAREAVEQYKAFLSLWNEADPERAEVADARARVARETR